MATAVLTLPLGSQEDVLLIRRRARDLAALLQFTPEDQISLSTAVWEVARLAERRGEAELAVVESPPSVAVRVTVSGVPARFVRGEGGEGLDLQALGRLVQQVEARDGSNGTAVVRLSSEAGADAWVPDFDEVELVLRSLTRHDTGPGGVEIVDELRQQNFELLTALAALRDREAELVRLNSELAAGQTKVRLAEVDVGELFGTLRAIITRLPKSEAVELRFDDVTGVPRIVTDAFKLSQIMRNFTVNALKFTEQGEVRVSAAATEDGEAVRFSVSDTGVGLSPEDQSRIFDEFVTLGPERHGRPRGTGLGLPLTRRLAALLGGEVAVESRLGEGSTFSVTLPVRFPGQQ